MRVAILDFFRAVSGHVSHLPAVSAFLLLAPRVAAVAAPLLLLVPIAPLSLVKLSLVRVLFRIHHPFAFLAAVFAPFHFAGAILGLVAPLLAVMTLDLLVGTLHFSLQVWGILVQARHVLNIPRCET